MNVALVPACSVTSSLTLHVSPIEDSLVKNIFEKCFAERKQCLPTNPQNLYHEPLSSGYLFRESDNGTFGADSNCADTFGCQSTNAGRNMRRFSILTDGLKIEC